MFNKSTDSFFLFSHRPSSTSKARRTGWSCPRRKSAGRSSSPRAVSSQTPATPTPLLTTKDLRTVNCPGHPHPHIGPPHVTGGTERGRGVCGEGPPAEIFFLSISSLFVAVFTLAYGTHRLNDLKVSWGGGGNKTKKTRKKRKCYRKCAANRTSTLMYTHTVHYNPIALW